MEESVANSPTESNSNTLKPSAQRTLDTLEKYEEGCFVWADVDLGEFDDPISGSRHHVKFKFPLVTPPHKFQPPEATKSESLSWVNIWLTESGLLFKVEEDEDYSVLVEKVKNICSGFVYGFSRMGIDSGTDIRAQAIMQFASLATLTDDAMEESKFLGIDIGSSIDALAQLSLNIIEGKIIKMEEIPQTIPIFNQLLTATFLTIDKCRTNFPEYASKCSLMADFFYPVAYGVMFLRSFRSPEESGGQQMPEDTFRYMRRYDGALTPLIELVGIMEGITLSDLIRRNLLFKRIIELSGSIGAHMNDILSVRKELASSQGLASDNLVFFKVLKGKSLQDAFTEVIAVVCEDTENIVYLILTLRNLYPDNEDLDKFLTIVVTFVDAATHWGIMSPRYGNNCTGTTFTVRQKGDKSDKISEGDD